MLTRDDIIKILKEKSPYLTSEYGVKRIGIFGSYAKDISSAASDVDIIVVFDRPIGFRFVEFAEYLENLLGKSVDVLTPAGIQGIRVERIAKSIMESVAYV
ncbi:MAG: nucleotidyltransferase family protein [Candidatus Omnitrophota bacterium]